MTDIEKLEKEIEQLKKAVTLLADICKQVGVFGCAYVDKTVHDLIYHTKI